MSTVITLLYSDLF